MANRRERERRRAGHAGRDQFKREQTGWTALSVPSGLQLWQPRKGNHVIDIIPYVVGHGNPCVSEPGLLYYERTYWVHTGIGVDQRRYVCPAKTARKPCPICEDVARLQRDPDADQNLIKALKPKERQLFLVYDHDEPDAGVQLWDVSYYNFGALLDEYRRNADEEDDYIRSFDDERAGATLRITLKEESMGAGRPFLRATVINFRPRKKGLPEELLDHGYCLDDMVKIESYERLKTLYFQEGDGSDDVVDVEEPDVDEVPRGYGREKQKKTERAASDDVDWDEQPTPNKRPPTADKAAVQDAGDEELWDAEQPDEKPPQPSGGKKRVVSDVDWDA